MYDVADNYLKYMPWSIPNGSQTGIVLSYHTLKPIIGADWFNSLLLLTPIGVIGLIFIIVMQLELLKKPTRNWLSNG